MTFISLAQFFPSSRMVPLFRVATNPLRESLSIQIGLTDFAATPDTAYAEELHFCSNQGTCTNCYEDLYFLHDTGKWFCLREVAMDCVGCHDGNPTATRKDQTHANRASHPIINDNISKCQECHPEQSFERVQMFRDFAGVSSVMVSASYVPVVTITEFRPAPVTAQEQSSNSNSWQHATLLLVGIVFTGFLIIKLRRRKETQQ